MADGIRNGPGDTYGRYIRKVPPPQPQAPPQGKPPSCPNCGGELRGAGGGQFVCKRCDMKFSVFNGQLVADAEQSHYAKAGGYASAAQEAYRAGDYRGVIKGGIGTAFYGGKHLADKIPISRPAPETSRAFLLIILFLVVGYFAVTRIFPGQLSAVGLSASGWIDSIKSTVTPKITDITEQMTDPWGKAERETKVETTVVGDVAKRDGVSLGIPPGGFASLAGGAMGQQLEAKVSNTGYGASNVQIYLENCDEVNAIVFTSCEDATKCGGAGTKGFETDAEASKPCSFKTAAGGVKLTSLPPDWPEPVKFYLNAEPGVKTDTLVKVKTKSVQAKVALKYTLEKSYRLLTYDVLSHMLSCNVEEAEALAGAKETEAYVTGGPLSVKIFATESKIKPSVPMKLSFDLVAVGSDPETTTETITINPDMLKVYIPQTLRQIKDAAKPNDEGKADPDGLTLEDKSSLSCTEAKNNPLNRLEPYYECTLHTKVVLEEGGAVRTMTFNLAPKEHIPEGIGPIIISVVDGGYEHTIRKERAIWVTQQAGAEAAPQTTGDATP